MKIVRIDSYSTPQVSFVKLTAEDGQIGWGQTSPYMADISTEILHRSVAPIALGKQVEDVEAVVEACFRENFIYKYFGSLLCRAICGIDTALWDMRGKREGKSVCQLLGGTPGPIPVYASSMRRGTRPEEEVERFKRWRDENGARAFKYKIAVPAGNNTDSYPGRSEALIDAMAAEFGDHVLIADANGGYTPERAIEVSRHLADAGVDYFEEPCPCWDIDATARANAGSAVTVAGGEQDYDLLRWQLIFEKKAVSVAQPDVCYLSGISRTLQVARMAAEHGLPVMPHSSNPSLVELFSMHLMAAIPNAAPLLEYGIEEDAWIKGAFTPALEMVDGTVPIPEGPGWGIAISEDWCSRAAHRCSELD